MPRKNFKFRIGIYIFVVILVHIPLQGVVSLIMDGIVIPTYAYQGDIVELLCQFRMEGDKLYSVIWYKDHEEFYRYVPNHNPRQRIYKLDGAKVDQQRSGAQAVKLRTVTPAASGLYRCEVSAEAPSFTSAHAEARMDVISLPESGPQITGEVYPRDYREGDMLSLNCTSTKSHPPAHILWFLNDRQVPAWFESRGTVDSVSVSGIRLRLSKNHFLRGLLTIRCVATVGDSTPLLDTKETFLLVRGSGQKGQLSSCAIIIASFLLYFYRLICT